MPINGLDEKLPFTPPPYYVPSKDLPRKMFRMPPTEHSVSEPSISRSGHSVMRRLSSRRTPAEFDNRVNKSNKKKRKPGLSIDTSVTRHNAKPPQEIMPIHRGASVSSTNVPVFQPPPAAASNTTAPQHLQYQPELVNPASSANSPSRFPPTYLDAVSRRTTLRQSQVPSGLHFAPPPRPASSLYSQTGKRRISGRRKSNRDSNSTTFEEDTVPLRKQRTFSNGTMFEEDGLSARVAPDTAYTSTPHRSRGWWNIITTPFAKTPVDGPESLPAVSTVPVYFSNEELVPPVPPIPSHHRGSTASHASLTLSPEDREVPIILGNDLLDVPQATSQASSTNPISPQSRRMPFADVGKTPPSGNDEFSPAGLMTGQGVVTSSRAIVNDNNVTNVHNVQQPQIVGNDDKPGSNRTSLRATVSRTVRFITPRNSVFPPPPGKYTATRHGGIVRQSVEYPTAKMHEFRAPPTPHTKTTFSLDYEEFEYEDDLKAQQPKRSKMLCLSCFGRKKGNHTKTSKNQKKDKKDKKKMSRRKKCCFCCLCLLMAFLVLIALIVVLAIMLSRKHNNTQTELPKWVNLTSLPPMITGTMTVARPDLVSSQSGCVNPNTAWSCAVPKEQQNALKPNQPTQPNFLFTVHFDNSTGIIKRASSGPARAKHFLRSLSFTPNPSPPTTDDQNFLGSTTDGNVEPFNGESTPFFISLTDPSGTSTSPTKVKRDANPAAPSNTVDNFATNIPKPSLNPDGTPPPANLLPFPTNQPIRLYNRGRPDEHYGFYSYYERNIFLRDNSLANNTSNGAPADENGGVAQSGANSRCTWTDTRFLVQIWTRKGHVFSHASSGSKMTGGDFTRPGSFPYPISITLDRHGGGLSTKLLYCYSLDSKGRLNTTQPAFQPETRNFNGALVNPSPGPFFPAPKVSTADGGPGGIDGGSGGCGCKWQNWS